MSCDGGLVSGIVSAMDTKTVDIIGAGLAGTEAALQFAQRGVAVRLFEMRPLVQTDVHRSGNAAELVCSNSLKSTKPDSAAGMLKHELAVLGSHLISFANETRVAAGGALAVDRDLFSERATRALKENPYITCVNAEVVGLGPKGEVIVADADADGGAFAPFSPADAVVIASGPLTSDRLASFMQGLTGQDHLSFYDAAAPVVMADSLDRGKVFSQSRYEDGGGDYLNAPFDKEEYERFMEELVAAERVIKREFETSDLFQACQPIEEIARRGFDAPRFGPLKPVGLTDPATGRRPWAVVQLRAEDAHGQSFNLVGFQTNLTFPEQRRVFRMIPGLENAEFARYGVMHRNSFIDAPSLLDRTLRLRSEAACALGTPVFVAGQFGGTEGYCEAIASGLYASLGVFSLLKGEEPPVLPAETAFGALVAYATSPETRDYQPMHVNFGIMAPIEPKIRNKKERYVAYAKRGDEALQCYWDELRGKGLIS